MRRGRGRADETRSGRAAATRRGTRCAPKARRVRRTASSWSTLPGHRDGDHLGPVAPFVVALDLVAAERLDRLGRPGDRPGQRGAGPGRRREEVVHHVVGIVVVHGDLVEDHLALRLHVLGGDQRGGDHVAEDVERHRQVVVEDPCVVAGVLARGERVELAADLVEGSGDVHRRAGRGALEQEMLQEVRRPVELGRLVPGSHLHEHPDCRGADSGHLLGDDAQTALEDGPAYAVGEIPQARVTRRRQTRTRPARTRWSPRRRPVRARACRGRRSRRSGPGSSGPRRRRPRRCPPACHRPAHAAC